MPLISRSAFYKTPAGERNKFNLELLNMPIPTFITKNVTYMQTKTLAISLKIRRTPMLFHRIYPHLFTYYLPLRSIISLNTITKLKAHTISVSFDAL